MKCPKFYEEKQNHFERIPVADLTIRSGGIFQFASPASPTLIMRDDAVIIPRRNESFGDQLGFISASQ
jgi:hypothetical protein